MHNQVSIASKLMVLMDRLSTAQLNGDEPITDDDLFGNPGLGRAKWPWSSAYCTMRSPWGD